MNSQEPNNPDQHYLHHLATAQPAYRKWLVPTVVLIFAALLGTVLALLKPTTNTTVSAEVTSALNAIKTQATEIQALKAQITKLEAGIQTNKAMLLEVQMAGETLLTKIEADKQATKKTLTDLATENEASRVDAARALAKAEGALAQLKDMAAANTTAKLLTLETNVATAIRTADWAKKVADSALAEILGAKEAQPAVPPTLAPRTDGILK